MSFDSFIFIGFVLISLLFYHHFRKSAIEPYVLLAINAIFLASFSSSFYQLLPLLSFLLLGYISIKLVENYPNNAILALLISIIIVTFVFLKRYTLFRFLNFLDFPYVAVGLSYILFRVIHLLVDISGGAIKDKVSFKGYFNYVCFFLNFVSGPIQRYQDFQEQEINSIVTDISQQDVEQSFSRIINGYIKIIFIAMIFYQFHQLYGFSFASQDKYAHNIGFLTIWYSFASALYLFYLYFNFSGYMDVVIGIGKLFGFDLPENFDRPFAANNFLNLWSRWHITLATWFKFYLFNPLLKSLVYRWDSPALSPYLGVIAFFVTFFFMGVWHGTTMMFLIYGLFLGLGVSVNKLYKVMMRKRYRKRYDQLCKSSIYNYLSRGLTLSYFSVSLTCLWLDLHQILSLFHSLILPIVVLTVIVLGGIAAIVMLLWDNVARLTEMINNKAQPTFKTFIFKNGWLAAKCFFLFYIVVKFASVAPEFVYKAF